MMRDRTIAVGEAAAEIRQLLAEVAPEAEVETSAVQVLPALHPDVLPALVMALARCVPRLEISRMYGHIDPEDPEWKQVVFELRHSFEPGSADWRGLAARSDTVLDEASAAHPEIPDLALAVGFDF